MLRFCPHCGKQYRGNSCTCKPKRKRPSGKSKPRDRSNEPWRKSYGTKEYREARQRAIADADGKCVDCGRQCAWFDGRKWRTEGMSGEVDHVDMLRHGGSNSVSNLKLRCASCHRKKDKALRRLTP